MSFTSLEEAWRLLVIGFRGWTAEANCAETHLQKSTFRTHDRLPLLRFRREEGRGCPGWDPTVPTPPRVDEPTIDAGGGGARHGPEPWFSQHRVVWSLCWAVFIPHPTLSHVARGDHRHFRCSLNKPPAPSRPAR